MEEGKIPIRHPSMVSRGICLLVFGGSDETYAFTHTHTHAHTHAHTHVQSQAVVQGPPRVTSPPEGLC